MAAVLASTAVLSTAVIGIGSSSRTVSAAATKSKATTKSAKAATAPKGAVRKAPGIYPPSGRPPAKAAPFLWNTPSPDPAFAAMPSFEAATTKIVPGNRLLTLLVIGSDARPKENFQRTRADSIHLFVWNPAFNKGILIGFPRDSYVDIPGRGKGKINSALSLGGPALLMATVNNITKKPSLRADRYVVTGFAGFTNMVNEIGGVNVLVDPQMNDVISGARFARGWHAMNGPAALAYARNRKGVAGGDFGRSQNQGRLILYTMAKLREEASDVSTLYRWAQSFRRNGASNIPLGDYLVMGQIVRTIDPVNVQNVVVSGKNTKVKGADVVQLDAGPLAGFFEDVSRDAVNDGK